MCLLTRKLLINYTININMSDPVRICVQQHFKVSFSSLLGLFGKQSFWKFGLESTHTFYFHSESLSAPVERSSFCVTSYTCAAPIDRQIMYQRIIDGSTLIVSERRYNLLKSFISRQMFTITKRMNLRRIEQVFSTMFWVHI